MKREDELTVLGKTTAYKQDYAPEVLEAFVNKHPENDYWVRFNCPEFTSLCPITGQPDFAQFERSLIKQRTREALRIKKQQGVKLGAPVKDYNDIDFSKGWEGSGLSRSSFYKAKKRRECKSV